MSPPPPPADPPVVLALLAGGAVVRRLLAESEALVFNLDTCGYASDITSIEQVLTELGPQALDAAGQGRHTLLRVDLSDAEATADAVRQADPDLVLQLAAESHVDRSIEGPAAYGSTSRHSRVMPTAAKLQAGYRLALSLEADGLRLIPQDPAKTSSARALIGCTGYQGPALELEAMDPACF
jgi:hypothetical protein